MEYIQNSHKSQICNKRTTQSKWAKRVKHFTEDIKMSDKLRKYAQHLSHCGNGD